MLSSDYPILHPLLRPLVLVEDAQRILLVENERTRRHAVGEENIRADRAAGSDDGVPAHDRRARVNRDVIFDCWMPFFSAKLLTAGERARDERHALIHLHVRADD